MMRITRIVIASVMIIACGAGYVAAVEGVDINKKGIEFGKKRQYDKAVDEFDKAIKVYDDNSAKLYHNRGWAFQQKGDFDKAIKNYEEAMHRNPKQVLSGEKLGFIYYQSKDYENAVRVGELVIKNDPSNVEVKKWLPDAYLKRLEQIRERELALKNKELEDERRKQLDKMKAEEEEKKETRKILVTFDFMLRTGYYLESKTYKFITDRGAITNVPETLYVSFTPTPSWELNLILENPYLGALTPDLIIHTEELQGLYRTDNYMLGLGIIFSHYDSDAAFNSSLSLWDVKVGLLFGWKKDRVEMKFTFYPRLLPYDGSATTGKSFDVAMFRIDYSYYLNPSMRIYSLIYFRDFFVFNNSDTPKISDYWGVYDIGLGVSLGRMLRANSRRDFIISMEFMLRFYLEDLNNEDPHTRAPNGQGYFGINSKKWLQGGAFSGYRTLAYVLGFRIDEEIIPGLFLYQKLIIEMAEEDHEEFNFQFGAGAVY